MTIMLLGGRRDARGRRTVRVIEELPGEWRRHAMATSDMAFVLLPEPGHFADGDRGMVRTPGEVPGAGPVDIAEGDVVAFPDAIGRCANPPGTTAEAMAAVRTVGGAMPLGTATDDTAASAIAAAWWAAHGTQGRFRTAPHDAAQLCWEHAADTASREPDEVLVLAWHGEDGERDLRTRILASSGKYMFFADGGDCTDAAVQQPDEPGLWRLHGARVRVGRDWETGIVDDWCLEGTMDRITPAAAATIFGWANPAEVVAEAVEALDGWGDLDSTGLARWLQTPGQDTAAAEVPPANPQAAATAT